MTIIEEVVATSWRRRRKTRITFIGHASLLIEANGLSIVSDPWWNGLCFGSGGRTHALRRSGARSTCRGRLAWASRSFPSADLEAVPGIEDPGRRGVLQSRSDLYDLQRYTIFCRR